MNVSLNHIGIPAEVEGDIIKGDTHGGVPHTEKRVGCEPRYDAHFCACSEKGLDEP